MDPMLFARGLSVLMFASFAVSGTIDYTKFSTDLEQELRELLFTNYSFLQRPSENVPVEVSMHLLTLNTLDVKDQYASITAYFSLSWFDSRLDWITNATQDYSAIRFLFSNENYVWRPALVVDNEVSSFDVISDSNVPMRINGNAGGKVTWNPGGIFKFSCDVDISRYPFDTQTCTLSLTSWAYTTNEISLSLASEPLDVSEYSPNGEWDLLSTNGESNDAGKSRGSYSFSNLKFSFTAKRRSRFHVLNTLIPVILMAYLSALVFKLPADSGEKVGFSLTVLLAYAVYLTLISDNIPSTSVTICLLSVYLTIILALGCVAVVLTIFVLNVYHRAEEEEIPRLLKALINHFLIYLALKKCCCKRHRKVFGAADEENKRMKVMDLPINNKGANPDFKTGANGNTSPDDLDETEPLTWQAISKIMDAAFFNVFFFAILISTLWFIIHAMS